MENLLISNNKIRIHSFHTRKYFSIWVCLNILAESNSHKDQNQRNESNDKAFYIFSLHCFLFYLHNEWPFVILYVHLLSLIILLKCYRLKYYSMCGICVLFLWFKINGLMCTFSLLTFFFVLAHSLFWSTYICLFEYAWSILCHAYSLYVWNSIHVLIHRLE